MHASYDYRCSNYDCDDYHFVHERFVRKEEADDQRCEVCGVTLDRLPSATGTTFSFAGRSAPPGRRK